MQAISLKCGSCGSALPINLEASSVTCTYCNANLVLDKSDNSITLRLAESFAAVKTGVDRTAAELALVRLDKELKTLEGRWNEWQTQHTARVNSHNGPYYIGTMVLGVSGLVCFSMMTLWSILGLAGILALFVGMITIWSRSSQKLNERYKTEEIAFKEKILALKGQIKANRAIVNGPL